MKKSLNRILLGTGLAGAALLSLSAATYSAGHGEPQRDPERLLAHMSERLDLTAGQRNQALQIVSSATEQSDAYQEELKSLREQLRAMRSSFDPDTARSIADRIGVITGNMVYGAASTQADIYSLLTPQQRAEMEEMQAMRDARRDKWKSKELRSSEQRTW